jgi:hypothetical protein
MHIYHLATVVKSKNAKPSLKFRAVESNPLTAANPESGFGLNLLKWVTGLEMEQKNLPQIKKCAKFGFSL